MKERQKNYNLSNELYQKQIQKCIEIQTIHKQDSVKRNQVFSNQMKTYIEKYHKEMSKVYAADEFLRETKKVVQQYLKRFKPKMALDLKQILSVSKTAFEAKIFNYKGNKSQIYKNDLFQIQELDQFQENDMNLENLQKQNFLIESSIQNKKNLDQNNL
ncbi:hypothetical protein IMG5_196040 [Ichthyophthirius multifiliis]|uniref:Uncharacterized protein n=1 Tax=Ichthyophthirius multifiliis TaxID=5932 RepID=G0R520_ICHMU|nr:hypothetical protein IMG5_196040 [Ichthyophthirius multifiliis]EGR27422.1 hypothetical protein IMG5_196040 [Ichthyophthirius multifiliis]|eukprot:XP_004024332.1 hypothetical protein IMG5_196040 [Ichthyophthirius multifiliis]